MLLSCGLQCCDWSRSVLFKCKNYAADSAAINRIHIKKTLNNPPPCSATIRTEGPENVWGFLLALPIFFKGFQLILLEKLIRSASKTCFLKRKSLLRGCIIKKNRACGAAILSIIPQNRACGAATQASFKFTGDYRALYTCTKHFLQCGTRLHLICGRLRCSLRMHKTFFYSVDGALRLGYIWFTSGYGALYACAKRFLTELYK